jgi:hypothetical protein
LVNTAVLKTFLSFAPARSQLWSRRLVLKVFPDAIETADGQDLANGFDRGYQGSVYTIGSEKNGVGPGGSSRLIA